MNENSTHIGRTCQLPPLTLQLTVREILVRWPQAAPLFVKHHMSCLGCYLDAFDTLEDALRNYAIPADAFLHQLCEAIGNEKPA